MQRLSQNTHFHALKRIGNEMNVRGGEVTQICQSMFYFMSAHSKISDNNNNNNKSINPFTAKLARKTTNKNAKLQIIQAFYPFARGMISIKMHTIASRFVIGPSNILFASLYVYTFQPGSFTGWGSEGVNKLYKVYILRAEKSWRLEGHTNPY